MTRSAASIFLRTLQIAAVLVGVLYFARANFMVEVLPDGSVADGLGRTIEEAPAWMRFGTSGSWPGLAWTAFDYLLGYLLVSAVVVAGDLQTRIRRRIFVSYRRSDSIAFAETLYLFLAKTFGHGTVFQDVQSIPAGSDFRPFIETSMKDCRVTLVLIGPEWNRDRRLEDQDDMIRAELVWARKYGVRIIPVLVGGAAMPSSTELPHDLRWLSEKQAVTYAAPSDLSKIQREIRSDIDVRPIGFRTR